MSDTHEDILLWFICEHGGKGIVTTDKLAEVIGESKETLHEWISYDNENGKQTMIMAIEAIKNGQTEKAIITKDIPQMPEQETIKPRDTFIMYRSFADILHSIDDLDAYHELTEAILYYALDHLEVPIKSLISYNYFRLMKPQFDANYKRYMNGCKPKEKKQNESKT